MDKNDLLGITTSCVVTLLIIFLVRTKAYLDAQNNILLIILLLFAMGFLGYGLSQLFYMGEKKQKPKNGYERF